MMPADAMPAHVELLYTLLPPNTRRLMAVGVEAAALARRYQHSYPSASFQAIDAERSDPAFELVHPFDPAAATATQWRRFAHTDCWVFDGALERLPQPQQVLAAIRQVMPADTCVVARVANAQHWRAAAGPGVAGDSGLLALFHAGGLRITDACGVSADPADSVHTHFMLRAVPD